MKIVKHCIECYVVKRVCNCVGCNTILSRYNLGDKCSIHADKMTVKEMHDYIYNIAAGKREPTTRKAFKMTKSTSNRRYG